MIYRLFYVYYLKVLNIYLPLPLIYYDFFIIIIQTTEKIAALVFLSVCMRGQVHL